MTPRRSLLFILALASFTSGTVFAEKKQLAAPGCRTTRVLASPLTSDVTLNDDLGNNLKREVPRYDVRETLLQWLRDARSGGLKIDAASGLIELTPEFDLAYTFDNGKVVVSEVLPRQGKALAAVKISEALISERDLVKLPQNIQAEYAAWMGLVLWQGLFVIRRDYGGKYHDEGLRGTRAGQRSVRLNQQYRVIYRELAPDSIEVLEITPHKY